MRKENPPFFIAKEKNIFGMEVALWESRYRNKQKKGDSMKLIMMLAVMLGVTSSAFAADCATRFGTKASVNASGNKLFINFDGHYRDAVLRASGQSANAYYFRNSGLEDSIAIVEKSVLSRGTGTVVYRYGQGGHDNGGRREVRLYCR